MLQMDSETERIVAVLHDVVKDTSWSLEELRTEGFGGQDVTTRLGPPSNAKPAAGLTDYGLSPYAYGPGRS